MPFLIALLAGAASAFAFAPFALWPLMPVAFALLCELIVRAPRLRAALGIGWGFAVGQFCVGLNWIATAFTYQAAMPAWLGWVAVVLLSLYLAVYPMIAVGLAWRFGRGRRIALALALAGGWAICEWLRGTMFTGFAWNPVGVVLADSSLIRASGAIGTYGLSALIVLLGAALWLAWHRERGAVGGILLAALVLAIAPPVPRPSDGLLRMPPVRIVQPNIGQQDKWREGFAEVAAERLAELSVKGPPVAVRDPAVARGSGDRAARGPAPRRRASGRGGAAARGADPAHRRPADHRRPRPAVRRPSAIEQRGATASS